MRICLSHRARSCACNASEDPSPALPKAYSDLLKIANNLDAYKTVLDKHASLTEERLAAVEKRERAVEEKEKATEEREEMEEYFARVLEKEKEVHEKWKRMDMEGGVKENIVEGLAYDGFLEGKKLQASGLRKGETTRVSYTYDTAPR